MTAKQAIKARGDYPPRTTGTKQLLAGIVAQAYRDLFIQPERYAARVFILSGECQAYCTLLGYDYNKLKNLASGRV
jgi:hypothetical protein